jgi:hypothetical protein
MLPNFIVNAQLKEWGDAAKDPAGCVVDGVPTLKCLEVVFGNILYLSSALIVLVLFIMFIVGSFQYLTSFGSAEKIKKAQGTLRMAVVGFVVFVSAYLILFIIDKLFLGGQLSIFKFSIGP